MVELFEASIIKFIKDRILERMGVNVSFKYSPDMDFIEEFRKDRFSKINNSLSTDIAKELLGSDKLDDINIAIWKRTPILKFKNEENGVSPFILNPQDKLRIYTKNGIELRDVFYGKTTFNIKLFSSEAKIIYLFELLYNTIFYDVNPPILVTYLLDGEPLEIDYNTYFEPIDSIDFINVQSYGGIQLIEFTFSVYGVFFSPFYYLDNTNTIEEIDLRVFAFNKESDITILTSYNLNNYNKDQLVCSETCKIDEKTHLIDEEMCESLHEKEILNK